MARVLAVAHRPLSIAIRALVLTGAMATPAAAQTAAPPVARAVRTPGPITIDGRLDEAAWQMAAPIGALTQREPTEGAPASESTETRVLFTADALYIGIVCHDRSPARIVSTQLGRDADLDVDDRVTVLFDPFFDHRNGFFFQVNPAGARTDGQVANNAESLTREWDGIWSAATRVTTDGWIAELEIPLKTLRFKPAQTVWGFNVERQIKRRLEIDRWAAARQNIWIGNLAEAGRLEGLVDLRQGLGLDVRPYASTGRADGAGESQAGLDVFKNLTPNLNAALTINTDFAETEADVRQVNLTRFALFYPEKRAFFLEGSGVFDLAGLATSRDLRPFFSRRVGLVGDATVPIRLGVKSTGRLGDYNVGVIDAETGASFGAGLPAGALDRQNLLALRVSRNLFEQSWIGGIVTRGNPDGTGANTMAGADARLATSTFRGTKNLALDLFILASDDGATAARDTAGGIRIDYPNDRWDVALSWKQIGERFQPALGFVPRAGIRKTDLSLAFQPRPARWGIRQFFFELNPSYITNLDNQVENWRVFTAPFNVRTESGEHLEWNYIPEFERLYAPFAISGGVVVPPGSYRWTRFRAEANSATKRAWVVDAAWWWGGFYDGTRRELELGLTVKPSTHVALSARIDRNAIDLAAGGFTTHLMTARADYSFSPDVSWSSLVQYDSESRLLGAQSRFRWILKPGNDLFVVVNRGWVRTPDDRTELAFDRATAKLQYTFRF